MIACLARVYYMVEEEYNATQDKKSVNIKNGIVILLYNIPTYYADQPSRSERFKKLINQLMQWNDCYARAWCNITAILNPVVGVAQSVD